MSGPASVRILTVCTGNICRSPAAERLLSLQLGSDAQVSSAGTRAVVGHPIEATMLELLVADAVPDEPFAARQLTPALVAEADIVLGLTRDHRADAVRLVPSAVRRTFTLLEFARIVATPEARVSAGGAGADRLRELIAVAGPLRGGGPHGRPDDVPDPYGRDRQAFEQALDLIRGAVTSIAGAVAEPYRQTNLG